METENFAIVYDGPDLTKMDVKTLGIVLLSVGNLVHECNRILNNSDSDLRVEVRSSFEGGCFKINFIISKIEKQLSLISKSETYKDLKEILAIIGILQLDPMLATTATGALTLLSFYRWCKNRKLEVLDSEIEIPENVLIKTDDGEEKPVPQNTFKLQQNNNINTSIYNIIGYPLNTKDIASVHFEDDIQNKTFEVHKNERHYFKKPIPNQKEIGRREITETYLDIINVNFNEESKWRFKRGENSLWALIKDDEFINKIDSFHEGFFKNSKLKVDLLEIELMIDGEIKYEYEILKVYEHIQGPIQYDIDI